MSAIDYGPIGPILEDPSVTEVMVNGPDDIWIERGGYLERTELRFESPDALRLMIEEIAAYVGRRVSSREAMLDARLPDGSRVNVILPPLSLVGAVVTIRRFPETPMSSDELVSYGSITPAAVDFLNACIVAKRNMLISGGTGAGKTTLLNVLAGFIPYGDRIVTIEDTAELRLPQPHWIRLETRRPDLSGEHEVTQRDLVRNSLRMRPDRIVVGEVRGGEALDMLQAMNTGHEGSMSTIHANSPRDAMARLETLVLMAGLELPQRAVRDNIGSALHLLVHLERTPLGQRRVSQISEIVGREGEMVTMQDVFVIENDRLVNTRIRPRSLDAMYGVRQLLPPGLRRLYPDPRLMPDDAWEAAATR